LSYANPNPITALMIAPIFHALRSYYRHALHWMQLKVFLPKF
jgi:hypothetical protein